VTFWRRPQWALIAYLWICYVLNHADRQVVYTLFPALQSDFGLSNTQLGLTGALFLWVYGLSSPLAGVLGDRWPRVRLVTGSLAVWSLFTLLTGFSPNGGTLLAFRALLGVSESLFMPAAFALMASAHGPASRSKAISIFATSQMVGVAMGGSASGWIAENFHWRIAFWALGATGVLFALPLWRFLRRLPLEIQETPAAGAASFRGFEELLRIPSLVIVIVYAAIATFGLFLVYTWLPTFLQDRFSLGMAKAGFEASIYPQAATLLGLLIGGVLADRGYARTHAARFWIILIAFCTAGPAIYALGQAQTLAAARTAATAFGFFSGFISGNQAASAFDVVPPAKRATAIGLLNLLGATVSGFAPFLGGIARAQFGVGRLMILTSGLYLLTAALLLYGIIRHFPADHERSLKGER
jgi:predicted MFS family arabinose efflux permease